MASNVDVARAVLLVLCVPITIPLLVWNVWRTGWGVGSIRLFMWVGYGLLMCGIAIRNAVGLGWLPTWFEFVAACLQMGAIAGIAFGYLITGRDRDGATPRG